MVSCENEKTKHWQTSDCPLSLQVLEKRNGTSNIKTGGLIITRLQKGGYSMNKLFYPAIFHQAEEGGFWVSFPDFPECFTDGDDMSEAYEMAVDALGLTITSRIENKEDIPHVSQPNEIDSEEGFVVVVEFDLYEYRRKHNSRAVKKTLSIPEWLNEAALSMGLNFSQVLQEALMEKVGMK